MLAGGPQSDSEYPRPEFTDLFDLPRCTSSSGNGLLDLEANVDPSLVQLIQGTPSPKRLCLSSGTRPLVQLVISTVLFKPLWIYLWNCATAVVA